MIGIPKGQREDARTAVSGPNRRRVDRPAPTPVGAAEDAAAARAEPGISVAVNHQARAAGGERALAGQGGRHSVGGGPVPGLAAVVGRQNDETSADRVAQGEAVVGVPECQGVEEALGVRVREL